MAHQLIHVRIQPEAIDAVQQVTRTTEAAIVRAGIAQLNRLITYGQPELVRQLCEAELKIR
jgi:hypothetical protein